MSEDEPASQPVTRDGFTVPSRITPARLGLGRAGSGMPTRAVLNFALDHAKARDAVHAPLDFPALEAELSRLGLDIIRVDSAAPDRATYLRRPDFGRRLSRESRTVLAARQREIPDVVLMVGDGLSSAAVQSGAAGLLAELVPMLQSRHIGLGPLVLAGQARVALGDEVGQILNARLIVILIGERPGLSAADSLGAYLTLDPRIGRTDADRNCVSNIRQGGLVPGEAARTLAWLIERAFSLGLTGVQLKDESTDPLLPAPSGTQA